MFTGSLVAQNIPRHLRVAEAIREVVAVALIGVCPGTLLTVCSVDVRKDLSQAFVYYSAFGGATEQIQTHLDGMAGRLRTKLARSLSLRSVPKLIFVADDRTGGGP